MLLASPFHGGLRKFRRLLPPLTSHMLTPFSKALPAPLEWTQKSAFHWSYELRQGDLLFATLNWRSSFGTLASATTADGAWTFKRVGFWSPRVTVRVEGSEYEEATFVPRNWSGSAGDLIYADGRTLQLAREGFWTSSWSFRDPMPPSPSAKAHPSESTSPEPALVRIADLGGMFRSRASLTISSPAEPRTPMLACLLWYLVILAAMDSAAGAAAAGAAVG